MSKEIILVYQDCVLCGDRGKAIKQFAAKSGVNIRKVSFASIEGQGHCAKAIESGLKSMPFYTDGKLYASSLERLIEAESEAQTANNKRTKRAKKTKEADK